LSKGHVYPFHIRDNQYSHQLYNLLSGKNHAFKEAGFKEILIDGTCIVENSYSSTFFFLCRLEELPGNMTAGDYLLLTRSAGPSLPDFADKKLSKLTPGEKEEIYMKILTSIDREIYLIDNICKYMSVLFVRRLKQHMVKMAENGALVFFLSTDETPKIEYYNPAKTASLNEPWLMLVDNLENLGDLEEMIKEKEEELRGDGEKKKDKQ
jgi:hypothetical protein